MPVRGPGFGTFVLVSFFSPGGCKLIKMSISGRNIHVYSLEQSSLALTLT